MRVLLSLKSPTFLKDGAVFIADSHYCDKNEDLYNLLIKFLSNPPPQIFLVGDIFHLLLDFEYLINYNKKVINIINRLSQNSEVFYFEGNHDFCLDGIFDKNVKVLHKLNDTICINHGDIYVDDYFYRLYSLFIRRRAVMRLLNFVTLNFFNNWLFKFLLNKSVGCEKFDDFKTFANRRLKYYRGCEVVIEGHYHQNNSYKNYISLPSLYCDGAFVEYKNGEFVTKCLENA
jgi:UDP-2,3-diacylglucosamine hydrolase